MKKYNLTAIMSRAWSIRKAAAGEIGCHVGEVVFSLCLKQAWAEAEGVNASANAAALVNEWAAMGESAQINMVSACIRKAAKNEVGYSVEDKYLQFAELPAFYLWQAHDFDEFKSEVFIRVLQNLADVDRLTARNERRASQGKRPLSLVSLVYNAARASVAAVYYQDAKHGAAYDREISDEDGNTASVLETRASDASQNTERAAIIRATLKDYRNGLDEIGKQVFQMVLQGKTEREIGESVGMSGVAVHKRIVKMRAALEHLRTA